MNNKKNTIIIIVILAIAVVGAFVYFNNSNKEDSGSSVVVEENSFKFASAKEILSLLNRMRSVKLEDTIFNDKGFISLQDTTAVLVPQPIERKNPFAPLGSDSERSSPSSQPQNTRNQETPFGPTR